MAVKVYISGISGNKEVSNSRRCHRRLRRGLVSERHVFLCTGKETPAEGHHDNGQQGHRLRSGGHHRAGQGGRKDVHAGQQQVQRRVEKRVASPDIQRRSLLRGWYLFIGCLSELPEKKLCINDHKL